MLQSHYSFNPFLNNKVYTNIILLFNNTVFDPLTPKTIT